MKAVPTGLSFSKAAAARGFSEEIAQRACMVKDEHGWETPDHQIGMWTSNDGTVWFMGMGGVGDFNIEPATGVVELPCHREDLRPDRIALIKWVSSLTDGFVSADEEDWV